MKPTDTAFPRSARLHASADFQQAFVAGQRLHGRLFRLHFLQASDTGGPRLGVSVSRRVDRRAVVRNRIKRQCRETFRRLRSTLAPGDYVLVARRAAASAEDGIAREELGQLLRRAAALKRTVPVGTMSGPAPLRAPDAKDAGVDPPTVA